MKKTKASFVGKHLILEFWGCRFLNNEEKIKQALEKSAKDCGAKILKFHSHRFEPQGISAIVMIAESHISVHTWPEANYGAFDIFTCGSEVNPYLAYQSLRKSFNPKTVSLVEVRRGVK